jgi:hypothetical protein
MKTGMPWVCRIPLDQAGATTARPPGEQRESRPTILWGDWEAPPALP